MSDRRDAESEVLFGEELGVTPINEAVSALLRARGLTATETLAEIMRLWPEAAGADLAASARPAGIRPGELVVEVPDPAWATKIRLESSSILGRLTDLVGFPVATRLAVRIKPSSEDRSRR
jgi:hypothetical protein